MVLETIWPENAPWWLNLFIWMAYSWQYILVGFVPAFYIAVAKLFGMPLLQRWSNEIVIMLYPSKVKFGKITQQYEPYFRYKKGIYWMADPLQPTSYENIAPEYQTKIEQLKERYEDLTKKEVKTKRDLKEIQKILNQQKRLGKKILSVNPINQIHIFTHAVNQPIYDMERRQSKVDELLNNDAKPKKIPGHGIWLLQNPKLHFHRHYQLIVDKTHTKYVLVPVKERQQFSIGFWHSLGIVMQKEIEVENEINSESSSGKSSRLIQTLITTHVVLQQMKEVQDYQNFSASRSYMLLKRRAKIEEQFLYWITGSINPLIFVILGGAVAAIAMIFIFLHGGGTPTPPTGEKPL